MKAQRNTATDNSPANDVDAGCQPQPTDVLLGRGRGISERKGNRRFQEFIEERMGEYKFTKRSKRGDFCSAILIESKKMGTRFMERSAGRWVIADDEKVRRKVGQAIRYRLHRLDEPLTAKPSISLDDKDEKNNKEETEKISSTSEGTSAKLSHVPLFLEGKRSCPNKATAVSVSSDDHDGEGIENPVVTKDSNLAQVDSELDDDDDDDDDDIFLGAEAHDVCSVCSGDDVIQLENKDSWAFPPAIKTCLPGKMASTTNGGNTDGFANPLNGLNNHSHSLCSTTTAESSTHNGRENSLFVLLDHNKSSSITNNNNNNYESSPSFSCLNKQVANTFGAFPNNNKSNNLQDPIPFYSSSAQQPLLSDYEILSWLGYMETLG